MPPPLEVPVVPETLEVTPIDGQPRATMPPEIVKKEMTPAKKAAVSKMFEGLKAKREAKKEEQERETAEAKEEKHQEKLRKLNDRRIAKRTPPVSSYVTMRDLEDFKKELLGVMPKTIYKEVPVDRIVPKVIAVPIETVREKVVQVLQPPKKITGNELLDSIFFR
jgi:hypothetical protein